MRKVSFPYIPHSLPSIPPLPKEPPTYRPVVAVRLEASNGSHFDAFALADSGADSCLFPLRLARLMNLTLARLPRATTSGLGSLDNLTYYETITVDIGSGIRFETKVGFTQGMDRAGFGLLGQAGFFENYNVEFRHRERIFTIELP